MSSRKQRRLNLERRDRAIAEALEAEKRSAEEERLAQAKKMIRKLKNMKKAELIAFAEENNIKINKAAKNVEIIDRIKEALK